ncbi:hypothetical protein [Nonomuraea endophytica]|uniref:Putative nucleic acid-binding protein n=1 Tax=Nonomuraea endophytica TaxID=714136 RepID=A0A7W8EDK4_9ACTN|nr:hypothetical protein [Nonomuraea endophytica]MBB5075488.1 putative nucleic acid-binding protein [Nonomuraea endophytica]
MKHPDRVVIDTNVLIVSNGKAEHVTDACVNSAIEFLEHVEAHGVVVLDSSWHIFDEYEKYCSFKGQPGVGDRFFLHLHRTQADPRHVQKVEISKDDQGSYLEIPDGLRAFDPSDHKFVAVVISDEHKSVIVNCADSDWKEAAQELKQHRIVVVELCDI